MITSREERAEQIFEDLEFFGVGDVCHFAGDETLPYEFEEPGVEILGKQIETYARLAQCSEGCGKGETAVIVASLESALKKTFPVESFIEHSVYIQHNDIMEQPDLAKKLHYSGYIRVPIVEARGEFAVRGGIVDVFPLDSDLPIRLDFFGSEVESIRYFDPSSQRSLKRGPGEQVALPPAKKNMLLLRALERGEPLVSLLSLLPAETVFVLDEPERFAARAREFWDLIARQHAHRVKSGEPTPPPEALYEPLDQLERRLDARSPLIEHHLIDTEQKPRPGWSRIAFSTSVFDGLKPHFETFLGIIRERLDKDDLVAIACDNDGQVQRLEELLGERHLDCVAIASSDRQARAFRS
ncbi:hypothetical protein AMJ85_08145, partial [candidate division BRC1 bacterium SM23_51]